MYSGLQQLIHDVSQPLSIIETLAYCLEISLPADAATGLAHLHHIRQQVEAASRILTAAQAQERASVPGGVGPLISDLALPSARGRRGRMQREQERQ
jgi:hypothetical protein